ncbi:MAG: DUF2752 domain-containing protein [Clostridia bacterium]|nr:DUF2752 domain-containing protein [Clostridia bacterium]
MKKNDWIWNAVKIIGYIIIIIAVALAYTGTVTVTCTYFEKFNIICPACGSTRATLSILHGDFLEALEYNAFYSLVILPLVIVFILEDIYNIIKSVMLKKKCPSFLDVLFGGIDE